MCEKEIAKEIYLAGLEAVMPRYCIPSVIHYHDRKLEILGKSFDLSKYRRILVYGSGKASIEMAKALKDIVGEDIADILVVSNYMQKVDGIEVLEASHPIPSQKSLKAGERLLKEFSMMQEDDFFIYLLSGGSSALIEKPLNGITLEDFQKVTALLLQHGLDISEINSIRKALSQIKGGALARATKAEGVVLVVSDVIGDDLEAIGSAPLLTSDSSMQEVRRIIEKYNILHLLPNSVKLLLERGDIASFRRGREFPHFLVASNEIALKAAKKRAKMLGLSVKIVSASIEGDVQDVASRLLAIKESEKVLLFGGEPTVNVLGNGNGGRNQELCLWVLKGMQKRKGFTFLSAGSDGIDGNSDAAGAVVCQGDYEESIDSYLDNSDSYHYLQKKEALIMTGESGTNVMDIMIVIQ